MPLSDHEQRLLEQIEQALYDEDPKFARLYQTTDVRTHYRRRLIRAVVGVVFGLAMLLAAVIVPLVPLGVAGFVVMLASACYGIASWQRMVGQRVGSGSEQPRFARFGRRDRAAGPDPTAGPDRAAGPARANRGERRARGERRSLMQRLEDRWQRRQDGNR